MEKALSEGGKVLRAGITLFGGIFLIGVSTDNVEVAKTLGIGLGIGLGLGTVYVGYNSLKPIIEGAVKKSVGGERDDQDVRDIRPGSLHFELHCFTDERFLEVLADYESGKMKERLHEELSLVGIKVEGLKVKIENMEEVNETRDAIKTRSYLKRVHGEMTSNVMRELSEMMSDISMDAVDSEGLKHIQRFSL
ncbi:uncharacterized protein LOC114536655 [Dendronephthya gigantea]|uniref:uncharacterized protein LOC114536655 n=1 Tax=Dendronephthya gigantea TaxID=151771 RepID=UPI00106A5A7E|nr:uncharacterized protein LOC114536655 [Dendronephthya gigantea]